MPHEDDLTWRVGGASRIGVVSDDRVFDVAMPLRNRVDPFGEIIAHHARGLWLGNRGCLHDAARTIRRPWQVRRWIILQRPRSSDPLGGRFVIHTAA